MFRLFRRSSLTAAAVALGALFAAAPQAAAAPAGPFTPVGDGQLVCPADVGGRRAVR